VEFNGNLWGFNWGSSLGLSFVDFVWVFCYGDSCWGLKYRDFVLRILKGLCKDIMYGEFCSGLLMGLIMGFCMGFLLGISYGDFERDFVWGICLGILVGDSVRDFEGVLKWGF